MSEDPVSAFRHRLAILLGGFTILWGVWVANPLWPMYEKSMVWSAMETVMPEWVWGLNSILAGSLVLFGWWHPSRTLLYWGLGAAVIHWVTISAAYFASDWENVGGLTALFIALLLLGCYDFEFHEKEARKNDKNSPRHL